MTTHGISQNKLAIAMGVRSSVVYRWFNERIDLTGDTLMKIVEAIREALLGGGDTDTNACIVGGLIGAACGASGIPKTMKNAVLQCDRRSGKNPRSEFLRAAQVPELVENLI